MKQIIATLTLVFFVVLTGYAQDRNTLKGPEAKNYKPWLNTEQPAPVYQMDVEKLKGPQAKNQLAWTKARVEAPKSEIVLEPREKVMGPAAKNAKRWKK